MQTRTAPLIVIYPAATGGISGRIKHLPKIHCFSSREQLIAHGFFYGTSCNIDL
jgi:hypothetical protein